MCDFIKYLCNLPNWQQNKKHNKMQKYNMIGPFKGLETKLELRLTFHLSALFMLAVQRCKITKQLSGNSRGADMQITLLNVQTISVFIQI